MAFVAKLNPAGSASSTSRTSEEPDGDAGLGIAVDATATSLDGLHPLEQFVRHSGSLPDQLRRRVSTRCSIAKLDPAGFAPLLHYSEAAHDIGQPIRLRRRRPMLQ